MCNTHTRIHTHAHAHAHTHTHIHTQEPTPMTEDMMWEHQKVLSGLGTSEEAALIRAKMQSSSLLSDMQAFKVSPSPLFSCPPSPSALVNQSEISKQVGRSIYI